MISKQDIQKLAALARIEVTETEAERLQHDLERILEYVDQLNRAETGMAEALTNITGMTNVAAVDGARGAVNANRDELLGAAPHHDKSFVTVPPIWKKK